MLTAERETWALDGLKPPTLAGSLRAREPSPLTAPPSPSTRLTSAARLAFGDASLSRSLMLMDRYSAASGLSCSHLLDGRFTELPQRCHHLRLEIAERSK